MTESIDPVVRSLRILEEKITKQDFGDKDFSFSLSKTGVVTIIPVERMGEPTPTIAISPPPPG